MQHLQNDESANDTEQFAGGTVRGAKKGGILAALAAAYQNIEKMAKEATIPTADPTRRRDTLNELFPKIRIFTGHDGFAVRTLKATRSVTLGSVLISCGEDKVMRISRTYSQELLVVVPGSFAVASGLHLEFYTDKLLSVHLDGTLRMWDVTVEPPKSTVLLSATMTSSQSRMRMEDVGQLFHESFHGQSQRHKYSSSSSGGDRGGGANNDFMMRGGGRSKRGSLLLHSVGGAGGAQASLRELLKDASSIADLAASGLRTSIGQPTASSGSNLSTSRTAGTSDYFSSDKKNNNNNTNHYDNASEEFGKQFIHRIPVTTLTWATESTPVFKLPSPGKKSQEQVFAVGTALGHVYICRWNMDSTEIEENDDDDDDDEDEDENDRSKSNEFSNNRSFGEDSHNESERSMDVDDDDDRTERTSGEDDDDDDGTRSVMSESRSTLNGTLNGTTSIAPAVRSHLTTPATNSNHLLSTTKHQQAATTTTTTTKKTNSPAVQQLQHISIDQIQQRMNDEANKRYKINVPSSKGKGKNTTTKNFNGNTFNLNSTNNNTNNNVFSNASTDLNTNSSTKPHQQQQRLVSSQSRLAASNKRLDRLKQRERDSTTANVAPVLALMPSPFDAPLVSVVGWNINHIERPTLTKDEQAGHNFLSGKDNLSAAEKIKLLEAVDSSASETMSKLRDAVGAEDRAAAREAQRRKTAGVSSDPQTNGGQPIPGHSCGVSCTILPGNNFMFSGDDRGVILMWDCRGAFSQDAAIFRRPRKRFQFGHVDAITSMAATSDGLLCSASKDALVVVWSWIDGVKLHTLHHHHHVVTGLTLASHHVPHHHHHTRQENEQQQQTDENNNNKKNEKENSRTDGEQQQQQQQQQQSSSSSKRNSKSNLQHQESTVSSALATTSKDKHHLQRKQSLASSAGGLSLFEGVGGRLGRDVSQVSAGTTTIFTNQPTATNTPETRSKSATTPSGAVRKGGKGGKRRHQSHRLQRRASSVASTRSHNRASAAAHQAIKPWVGGVVVNNKRYNDNPNRKTTVKTLLITSSLDETIQCFEINPFGTQQRQQQQQQRQQQLSDNNVNKNNSDKNNDNNNNSHPIVQQQHTRNDDLQRGNSTMTNNTNNNNNNNNYSISRSQSVSQMNTVQSGYLPPSMMTGRSIPQFSGGVGGHSFALSATTATRSRANSVVGFELV